VRWLQWKGMSGSGQGEGVPYPGVPWNADASLRCPSPASDGLRCWCPVELLRNRMPAALPNAVASACCPGSCALGKPVDGVGVGVRGLANGVGGRALCCLSRRAGVVGPARRVKELAPMATPVVWMDLRHRSARRLAMGGTGPRSERLGGGCLSGGGRSGAGAWSLRNPPDSDALLMPEFTQA